MNEPISPVLPPNKGPLQPLWTITGTVNYNAPRKYFGTAPQTPETVPYQIVRMELHSPSLGGGVIFLDEPRGLTVFTDNSAFAVLKSYNDQQTLWQSLDESEQAKIRDGSPVEHAGKTLSKDNFLTYFQQEDRKKRFNELQENKA